MSFPISMHSSVDRTGLPGSVSQTRRLVTVRQPFRELGVTAMETMNLLLAGAPAPSRHVILPTTLVVRASCGCRYAEHNPPIPEDRLVLS